MSDSRSGAAAAQQRIRLPLLDRLIDADPDAPRDPPLTSAFALDVLRAAVRRDLEALLNARHRRAVRRDLEALLNARRRRLPLPAGLAELPASPVGYGVPDPTAGSFTQEERRAALAREVEAAIRRFEPRLTHVSVRLQKLDRELIDRSLRVRIDAILRTDPVPEQVSFETVVRPTTLDVTVREGTGPGGED